MVKHATDSATRLGYWSAVLCTLLIPFLVFQMYWHSLIWVASLWAITFPGAMVSLALMFHRDGPAMASERRIDNRPRYWSRQPGLSVHEPHEMAGSRRPPFSVL
jgi:hypothetical protein